MRPSGSSVVATRHTPPSTGLSPNRSISRSRWRIPFSSGTIIVSGPTEGARSASAGSSA